MKIRNASQLAVTTQMFATPSAKTPSAQVPDLVKPGLPLGLGLTIPGWNNGLPGGFGKNGLPGLPGNHIPGFDKSGRFGREGSIPGLGRNGFPGGIGGGGFPGIPGNTIPGFENKGVPG